MIKDNVRNICEEIAALCASIGRDSHQVTLVGVTKLVSLEGIEQALEAGITYIAENRVQEAENKFPLLVTRYPQVATHLIGHLQTNKAKDAIKVCSLIQSVDSLKLAYEIDKHATRRERPVDILVQFNTAREAQKFGADPSGAYELIEVISQLRYVHVKGLMCMAPYTGDQSIIRKSFADLRLLREQIINRFSTHPRIAMGILSMGMSSDYKIAIEEGSTMVRIGSAIFK